MSLENEQLAPTVAIHQPEFLPWLGFIDKIRQVDTFVLLDSVQFEKNYYQNRNKIRTAWGWAWLTLPVFTKGLFGQAINQVKIQNEQNWTRKHILGLEQNYQAAPYFGHYFNELKSIYSQPRTLLVDFNFDLIRWMAKAFGLTPRFVRSSELGVTGKKSELLLNICESLGTKIYLSGVSGRDYLDESLFEKAGIAVRYQDFHHPSYPQRYEPFLPGMSAVDLLFNEGPSSLQRIIEANQSSSILKTHEK